MCHRLANLRSCHTWSSSMLLVSIAYLFVDNACRNHGGWVLNSCITATGFFWKRRNQTYLITNWHVVTGIDPLSKDRNPNDLIPRWLEYYVVRFTPLDNNQAYTAPVLTKLKIELKPFGQSRWLQHPKFNEYAADIAAIPIGSVGAVETDSHVNEYGFEKLFHFVGDEAFVVGYPLRSYADTMIPIWKRASLATKPLIQIDDRPMFLVDASTTEGMSGSRFSVVSLDRPFWQIRPPKSMLGYPLSLLGSMPEIFLIQI
jgi:hypothetical protein